MQRSEQKYHKKLIKNLIKDLEPNEAFTLRFKPSQALPTNASLSYKAIYQALHHDNTYGQNNDQEITPGVELINTTLFKKIAKDELCVTVADVSLSKNKVAPITLFNPPAVDAAAPCSSLPAASLSDCSDEVKSFELLKLIRHYNALQNINFRTDIDFTYQELLIEFRPILLKQLEMSMDRVMVEFNNFYRFCTDTEIDANSIDKYVFFLCEGKINQDKLSYLLVRSINTIQGLLSIAHVSMKRIHRLEAIAHACLKFHKDFSSDCLSELLDTAIAIANKIDRYVLYFNRFKPMGLEPQPIIDILRAILDTGKVTVTKDKKQDGHCEMVRELLSEYQGNAEENMSKKFSLRQ